MFTDTHCHMSMIKNRGYDVASLINELVDSSVPFVLDIGTDANDLPLHIDFISNLIEKNIEEKNKKKAYDMFYFSAGIWPDRDAILNRDFYLKELEKNVLAYRDTHKICAIGECGLDRNWNKADEKGLIDGKNAQEILSSEEELFEMQIELAQKLGLPVIVHSRDAAVETYNCIKNCNWNNGVIHCYSYGKKEAKMFLDLGWYISLSGSITYAKKSQIDATKELVQYIPQDLLLLETDAPYLAPVPLRGKVNTPVLVRHVYDFVSSMLGIESSALAEIILANTKKLFCG